MVLSKIDTSISYPEKRSVEDQDKEQDIELYKIQLKGYDIIGAIGREQQKIGKSKNTVYFPLYMIKNTGKAMQVGVYEIESDQLLYHTDDNGELIMDKMPDPLPYVYVSDRIIENNRMLPPGTEESNETQENDSNSVTQNDEEDLPELEEQTATSSDPEAFSSVSNLSIPNIRADVFEFDANAKIPKKLAEETLEISRKEFETFELSDKKSATWIQKIMKNLNYGMIEVENNGDCFFAAIREAFAGIGQITNVEQLRKKLSREISEEVFKNYMDHFTISTQLIKTEKEKVNMLKESYEKYKTLITSTISSTQQNEFINNAKSVAREHDDAASSYQSAKEIYSDYSFMRKIKKIEDLVNIVKTSEYWADVWAITTMERILNVKFIILSSDAAKKDSNNMLQCGISDEIIASRGTFEPEFYIILEHANKNHYRLITYHNKTIFEYSELPYDLKILIVTKCLEKNSGTFVYIPEFRHMTEEQNKSSLQTQDQIIDLDVLTAIDSNTVFQFYDKSMDGRAGTGTGEKIEIVGKKFEFADLSPKGKYPNWRRKLHNKYMHSEDMAISLDNYHWNSAQHFIEASKFKNKEAADFYFQFTRESGSEISKDVELAIIAGSKSGKKGRKSVRPAGIEVDNDYYGKKEEEATLKAMKAKFSIPHFRDLLKATKDATLNKYISPGKPVEIDKNLVKIRTLL